MAGPLLFLLALLFVVTSAVLLTGNKGRLHVFLNRFLAQRRMFGLSTLKRHPSLHEKSQDLKPPPAYVHVFPPARRFVLTAMPATPVIELPVAPPGSSGAMVPLETSYLKASPHMLTPTGFAVQEVKALGDFPDYATLSGVPLPAPYTDFDITKACPRPYRPLRWAYHQTMSLTKMESDWWLELESTYADRVKQRQELFAKNGSAVLDALPGSQLECKELMEMALQFLCARYPQYFSLDTSNMVFYNGILGTTSYLKTTHPLHVLLDNVPEDFAIVMRDPATGFYVFRAGLICSALGWNVASKIGLQLHEIHAPIPDYKEKMQFSMDRYFAKKPTDKPIQRGSWGLEVDQPLYMPPGDPHEKHREVQHPGLDVSRCHLRVDWQTLRRLPLSGAIVFNFKAIFTPVTEFRNEPFIPALMVRVLEQAKRSYMEYKNTWHTEHAVMPALEQYAREQVQKGLVPKDWEPHTLDESPYFPGWEAKWHAQQGF